MKLPLSWLKEYLALEADEATLSHRLSLAGLEVESIEHLRAPFSGVTIARVLEVRRHPNADRLNLCEVDAGAHGQFRVVCGAPNVHQGMIAPLAMVGARLGGKEAGGLESAPPLSAAVIRGERSEGMLCSGRELGLSDDHSGIVELDAQAPLGTNLADFLGLDDTVLDLAITPNRGDCLSILGLAREIGALFGLTLRQPRWRAPRPPLDVPPPSVEIAAMEQCPRYAGLRIDGVRVGPSPAWMRRRLELCGMRAVNNLVDVTNYVMLELGQPLHAFDFAKLAEGRIVVRQAQADRDFLTLDGVARQLAPTDLVIADGRGPVAIAGVMGGQSSEVGPETTSLLIESAYFEPDTVARTARRLGLHSEASYRFERGIDRDGQVIALWRAAELLTRFAGGKPAAPICDLQPRPFTPPVITLDLVRMAALLGVALPGAEVRRRLMLLGAKAAGAGKDRLTVTIPSFRSDLREAADLAEEVARLSGLEEIPERLPARPNRIAARSPIRDLSAKLREIMLGCGLTEVHTLAFAPPEDNRLVAGADDDLPIAVANPLSAELSELRLSLLPGLLSVLRFNLNRQAAACHAFELAKVFAKGPQHGPAERLVLAGIGYGDFIVPGVGQPALSASFASAKGIVERVLDALGYAAEPRFVAPSPAAVPYLHPGKAALVYLREQRIGVLGEPHPAYALRLDLSLPCGLFELDISRLAQMPPRPRPILPPPRYPAVRRDLALVLDRERNAGEVVETLRTLDVPWLESAEVFDVYAGEGIPAGKKSLALALRYRAERTLTDEEVNSAHESLVRQAIQRLNAQLRQ